MKALERLLSASAKLRDTFYHVAYLGVYFMSRPRRLAFASPSARFATLATAPYLDGAFVLMGSF